MLSINQRKLITSLQRKKNREAEKLFVIEGDKIVREYLEAGSPVQILVGKPEWIGRLPGTLLKGVPVVVEVSFDELRRVSSLTTPHNALAVVSMEEIDFSPLQIAGKLTLALENIQDPGNMGTIIRTAAWFGIGHILCSPDSADRYNPKVIQASMGALLSVNLHYLELREVLEAARSAGTELFATTLEGRSMYESKLSSGIVLFGNESSGISPSLRELASAEISIPLVTQGYGIESLNVGSAAAIVCSEFRRQGL